MPSSGVMSDRPPAPSSLPLLQRLSRNLPLRIVFTVPMLLQLIGVVGLVGYLSFRNGQQAVQDLASQVRSELTARIQRELQGYFSAPHSINRLNATAFTYGDLDIVGAQRGENMLFQQMRIHPTIAFAYCGSAQNGEFFGVLRRPDTGQLQLSYGNASNDFFRENYSLDVRGSRMHRLSQLDRVYDARTRPWFKAAVAHERPVWTDVYLAFSTGLPNVTASLPVYDSAGRNLLGVCATDVVLPEEFREFLSELDIGESGQAFVVDRRGNLISSSTDEELMINTDPEDPQFRQAVDSGNELIQTSASYLTEQFGSFDHIREAHQLTFNLGGDRKFLEVLPFSDGFGLDWLIVVVVPESDFTAEIQANTRTTIALCLIALAIAVALGIALTRWVTYPILRLNDAIKTIAAGNWQGTVDLHRSDEVGQLADSFNQTIAQLHKSFKRLEVQRNAFSRFFPPEYLTFLDKPNVTQVSLGDHINREMAITFSDIRSFTSLSEKLTPQETFDFINSYLKSISPPVRDHNGIVVKFLGDGMMSVFPDGADAAVSACIAQLKCLQRFNETRVQQGEAPINVGFGIHIGNVMVGIVGEENRLQADALSDIVNLTARLEGLSKYYGVPLVISEDVLNKLEHPDRYHTRFLDRAIVKGRTEVIAVYEVFDIESEGDRRLKQETLPMFEKALEAYRDGKPLEAREWLEQVLTINPNDKTAILYLQRVAILYERGVPRNWDGVWAFTQK
ncbi:MAG: adenylate/guanylate cyclase domain-containing protein [Cyanobacteria bacterium J06638_20]